MEARVPRAYSEAVDFKTGLTTDEHRGTPIKADEKRKHLNLGSDAFLCLLFDLDPSPALFYFGLFGRAGTT
jgi:hypothetical protein